MIRKLTKDEQYQLNQRFGPLLSKYFLEMIDSINSALERPNVDNLESVYSVNPPEESNGGISRQKQNRNKRLSGTEPGE